MEPEEYFERVVRFLETKGWNTSTTQVNDSIYIVTGTRKSETYYDRMMAMVGIDAEMRFGEKHLRYLVDAAADNDVDRLVATSRGGVEEDATDRLQAEGIEFIDPETIDDAFIDEFQIEREEDVFEQARASGDLAGFGTDPFRRCLGSLVALYLLAGGLFGVVSAVLGLVGGPSDPYPALLAGALVLLGPFVALVGTLALVAGESDLLSPAGIFLGAVFGYLLFIILVGAGGGVAGLTASTGLFDSVSRVLVVFALAVPTGAVAVAVAYTYALLAPQSDQS